MKAKNLIIICSHLKSEDFNRYFLVDKLGELLGLAKRFSLKPILVLGLCGDEVLSLGVDLQDCELTFDSTYKGDFLSSVQVGLEAVTGAAFVEPVTAEGVSEKIWQDLDRSMWALRPADKPEEQVDVLYHPSFSSTQTAGFPQLVTLAGAQKIRNLPENTAWGDQESLNINMATVEAENASDSSKTGT